MASFKVILGPGRFSYPNIFKPQTKDDGSERYSVAFLMPPATDLAPLKLALKKAMADKFGADESKWPRGARKPEDVIVPAEEKYGKQFEGWHVINASSATKPGVVDRDKEFVTDASEMYPGRWGKISVAAFGYSNKTRGVTLGLNNCQILKHDEPLAGKPRASDEFDAVAEEMSLSDTWA